MPLVPTAHAIGPVTCAAAWSHRKSFGDAPGLAEAAAAPSSSSKSSSTVASAALQQARRAPVPFIMVAAFNDPSRSAELTKPASWSLPSASARWRSGR